MEQKRTTQQWEYNTIQGKTIPMVTMNEFGAEGWELVSVIDNNRLLFAIFKRPLPQNNDAN